MKKLTSVIIITILLFSCLGFTTFATPASATISDDYQEFYLDGNTYSRFDTSALEGEHFTYDIPVELSATQKENLREVILETNEATTVIYADIHFKDGAVLSVGYLRNDYVEMYNEMLAGQNNEYVIDFEYPDDNTITVSKTALYGKSVTLTSDKLEMCDYYPVIVETKDATLTVYKGSLLTYDESYYYVDFQEAKIESWYDFSPYEYSELPAYEISDAEILASIRAAEDSYYSDDLGFLLNDNFTETVSAIFLIIVFAVIPFAIFVVFLILAIRSKTVYKKMFRTIYIFSATLLVVFTIVATFVMLNR